MTVTQLVIQEDKNGCGAACLAMVLGKTYAEAAKLLPKTFREKGTSHRTLVRVLRAHELAVLHRPGLNPPFSPIHLVRVAWDQFPTPEALRHLVVMDKDGVILDPVGKIHSSLTNYPRVCSVMGIVPFSRVQS